MKAISECAPAPGCGAGSDPFPRERWVGLPDHCRGSVGPWHRTMDRRDRRDQRIRICGVSAGYLSVRGGTNRGTNRGTWWLVYIGMIGDHLLSLMASSWWISWHLMGKKWKKHDKTEWGHLQEACTAKSSEIFVALVNFGGPKVFCSPSSRWFVTSGADLDLKDRAAPFQRLRQVARGQGRLGRRVVRSSVTAVNFTYFTPQNIPNVMDVMDWIIIVPLQFDTWCFIIIYRKYIWWFWCIIISAHLNCFSAIKHW